MLLMATGREIGATIARLRARVDEIDREIASAKALNLDADPWKWRTEFLRLSTEKGALVRQLGKLQTEFSVNDRPSSRAGMIFYGSNS
jgi:hypothetical protein